MHLKNSFFLMLLLCTITVHGQQLSTTFTIRNAGFNVDGKFTEAKVSYVFNPKNLNNAYFKAEVQVASIDTGIGARDKHLLKDKYFDSDNFPKMSFSSSRVVEEGNQFFILGKLTIKGVAKEMKVPLTVQNGILSVEFMINRRDFDVGGNSFILSDDVNIKLELTL
jgi:polyisoprenoid-binding protein YceI